MTQAISIRLRAFVRRRAQGRCEYCLFHENDVFFPHEIDHIIATKHRGPTQESNLAWTCFYCNRHKGSDLSSLDPKTERLVRLFHPRRDKWKNHFRPEEGLIIPKTAIGRVTVFLLQMNLPGLVKFRAKLLAEGLYPP